MRRLLGLGSLLLVLFATIVFADTMQKSPTSCGGQWILCSGAFSDGSGAAYTTKQNMISFWTNYGFNIPFGSTVNSVVVRSDFWASRTNGYIDVRVSNGTSWGPIHRIGGNTAERTFNIDVTNDFTWTQNGLSNSNFKVMVQSRKLYGGSNPLWRLDWIPVTVEYTPPTPSFGFSVSTNPISGTVRQGNSTQTTVTVTLLGGVSQNVALSQSGCPPFTTCTFNPSNGNPTYTSTFTIATTNSTPTGTYPINITGTVGGLTRTAIYVLAVLPSLQPDLTLDTVDIKFHPPVQNIGGNTTVTTTIHNVGTGDAGSYRVRMEDITAGCFIGLPIVSGTPAGGTSVVKLNYTVCGPAGNHTIQVMADAVWQITETDESNNIAYNSNLTVV